MKVLVTGASGFVGSHILDSLRVRGIATAVLLRLTSNTRLIAAHLPHVEVRTGSIVDPPSLQAAMRQITHVIHCAGCTKALRVSDFYEINQIGTRRVVAAINQGGGEIQRLVHISSLAAGGPAMAHHPAREDDPPHPVSEYGKSKLDGEKEVQSACQTSHVILRPPAVYGPGDADFLRLFKTIHRHLLPHTSPQPLSLVYVKDLAEAVVSCLTHPAAVDKTFYVASPEILTARAFAEEIARQMDRWTLPLPMPTAALWPVCCLQEVVSRLTGKPNILSRQKYPELRAPGWVCDPARLNKELGVVCATTARSGINETLAWYRQHKWL